MRLHFKHQQYQTDAASAVVRCFIGQSKGYRKEVAGRTGLFAYEIFSNKKLEITDSDILKNVQTLQKEQGNKGGIRGQRPFQLTKSKELIEINHYVAPSKNNNTIYSTPYNSKRHRYRRLFKNTIADTAKKSPVNRAKKPLIFIKNSS